MLKNLSWNQRADGAIFSEPFGLDCGYFIKSFQLQIISRRKVVVDCYINTNILVLQQIAQAHYARVLKHHI